MIQSYRCKDTEKLASHFRVQRFRKFERIAQRKLALLNAAVSLEFLRTPPGNRLEELRGKREGSYSIRINDHWKICFRYRDGDAFDVEMVDYNK